MAMALKLLLLLLTLIFAAYAIEESRTRVVLPYHQRVSGSSAPQELPVQGGSNYQVMSNIPRRLMIGSTAPTCTYNECRGCKYKCRAEQVPVEGTDPINSAYHYRCVCHR